MVRLLQLKKNTNQARTLDCIYMQPLQNDQGRCELLHLTSGELITRPTAKPIPLPESIIKIVEGLAEWDGMTELKFADWRGNLILSI